MHITYCHVRTSTGVVSHRAERLLLLGKKLRATWTDTRSSMDSWKTVSKLKDLDVPSHKQNYISN